MNWRLVALLSCLSVVLAAVSLIGFARGHEWVLWLLIGIIGAWQFATKVSENHFLHGLYLGIFSGILNSIFRALFFESYIASNPNMLDALAGLPQDLSPRMVILIMGPLVGSLVGVVYGLLAAAGSLVRKRTHARPS